MLPAEGFFYLADFEEFLRESVLEDTFERTASSIVVSTIHKAKGREFDHVYILYASRSFEDDDARRKLYVGMTRARFDLTIHYRGALLNQTLPETVHPSVDKTAYNAPDELTLTLTHEDVWLDYFEDKKRLILSMRAGFPLTPIEEGLTIRTSTDVVRLVVYSKAFQARLAQLKRAALRFNPPRSALSLPGAKPGRSGACRRFADPSPQTRQQRPNGIDFLRFDSQIGRRPQ